MQLPDLAQPEDPEDVPELQPIEQLEFFRTIGPAFSYVNIPGFGKIACLLQGGDKLNIQRGDVLTVEASVIVTGAMSDNKGRKIKGVPRYVRTKKDEFVYLTQPVDAEIIAQHRPETMP